MAYFPPVILQGFWLSPLAGNEHPAWAGYAEVKLIFKMRKEAAFSRMECSFDSLLFSREWDR
jgi:hypothetical protein